MSIKSIAIFDKLNAIISHDKNYENYKKILDVQNGSVVPYIGVFLRDLTFIEVGNASYLDDDLINFDKLRMIYAVLRDFSKYKSHPYDFTPLDHVRNAFIEYLPSEDEDALYSKSIELEPKASNTKKSIITRLRTKT